ncbi:P-loop containing nucleoside triphosphate hydrolase protein [Ephemerocybe angulata]|uniref:P-loop containing nucleoside triphosphate hydrolase protein n=1 Tax=Ephemerocybe angulata TaxID=980116 RepID=A0A8H6HEA8_9AGAR|nr:P-loop containing nucleoside triphosphate hydrolase protein [Tulosesus angulatus]
MLIPRTEPTNALCNIVILVVGETGAGKSYFVNKLLEVAGLQHRATIGDEVQPCTVDITHVVVPGLTSAYPALSGFQVDIVDTPGFKSSDGPASDEALFRRIETWLKENCRDAAVLGGIIYLHDISKDRLPDECQKNVASLQPFFKLGPMDKVVLVTSKWGKIYNRDFEEREKQLLKQDWAPMVTEGADVKRFKAEGTGARRVVGGNWNILPSTPNSRNWR